MPEFQRDQRVRVRVREEGGAPGTQPEMEFLGQEGTIQYGTGNLDGGAPTFCFVEFDGAPARKKVMAISADWLEPE